MQSLEDYKEIAMFSGTIGHGELTWRRSLPEREQGGRLQTVSVRWRQRVLRWTR